MKQIECTNTNGYKLRKGKVYDVISESETRYEVVNEAGLQRNYSKKLFKEVVKNLTYEQVLESMCIVEGEVQFKTQKNEDIELAVTDFLKFDDTEISCGIKQLSGVNELVVEVCKAVEEEYTFPDQQKENLISRILRRALFCAAGTDIHNYKFLLLSTNTDKPENPDVNSNFQRINRALTLRGESTQLISENPNTGNEICLWILDVEEVFKEIKD